MKLFCQQFLWGFNGNDTCTVDFSTETWSPFSVDCWTGGQGYSLKDQFVSEGAPLTNYNVFTQPVVSDFNLDMSSFWCAAQGMGVSPDSWHLDQHTDQLFHVNAVRMTLLELLSQLPLDQVTVDDEVKSKIENLLDEIGQSIQMAEEGLVSLQTCDKPEAQDLVLQFETTLVSLRNIQKVLLDYLENASRFILESD